MKRKMSCLLFVCLGLAAGARSFAAESGAGNSAVNGERQLIVRLHHGGVNRLNAENDGTVFKEIWNLPTTVQLRNDALDKLASAMATQFRAKAGGNRNPVGLLRPLLDDALNSEFFLELLQGRQAGIEASAAVHLDQARSQLWQKNWAELQAGWEIAQSQISLTTSNGWVVVRVSPAERESAAANLAIEPLRDQWLTFETDGAHWARLLPKAVRQNLPHIAMRIAGRKEYLRTEARLQFPEPVVTKLEKWEIPMESIRDPLISFSAVQGISPWLKKQPVLQELGLNSMPNQAYQWGLSSTSFQIQGAASVPDAEKAFNAIASQWVPKLNRFLETNALGNVRRATNETELIWRGLPLLVPYLHPVSENGRQYLHGGIFPVLRPPTNPPPQSLFQQLTSPTNLAFYSWEITQLRLNHLRPLLQLSAVFLTLAPMSTNSVASKWLDNIEPRLGNTVTEVAVNSPRELQLTRTSHIGLNGLELLTLANWLEGTNFPRANLDIGFRPPLQPNKRGHNR